eukprot:10283289-Ditylum_brightwellii.AAC.1
MADFLDSCQAPLGESPTVFNCAVMPTKKVPSTAFSDKGTGKGGSDTVQDSNLVALTALNMAVNHKGDKIMLLVNMYHICRGFIEATQTKFCLHMTCLL